MHIKEGTKEPAVRAVPDGTNNGRDEQGNKRIIPVSENKRKQSAEENADTGIGIRRMPPSAQWRHHLSRKTTLYPYPS